MTRKKDIVGWGRIFLPSKLQKIPVVSEGVGASFQVVM